MMMKHFIKKPIKRFKKTNKQLNPRKQFNTNKNAFASLAQEHALTAANLVTNYFQERLKPF